MASCAIFNLQVSQSISLLFHPAVYNGKPENTDWNVKHLFGIGLAGACPVADNSQVLSDNDMFPLSNQNAGVCGAEFKACGAHSLPSP